MGAVCVAWQPSRPCERSYCMHNEPASCPHGPHVSRNGHVSIPRCVRLQTDFQSSLQNQGKSCRHAGAHDIEEAADTNMADDCPPPSAALLTLCWVIGSSPAIQWERYHNPLVAVLNTSTFAILVQVITILLYGYSPPTTVVHWELWLSLCGFHSCVVLISSAATLPENHDLASCPVLPMFLIMICSVCLQVCSCVGWELGGTWCKSSWYHYFQLHGSPLPRSASDCL